MSSTSFVYPSRQHGIEVNKDIRFGLIESLNWCLSHPAVRRLHTIQVPEDWIPQPPDYGAYYDLAVLLTSLEETGMDQANGSVLQTILDDFKMSLGTRSAEYRTQEKYPQITTLREPFYRTTEVASLIKWLDLESENSISLTHLDDGTFHQSKEDLVRAIDALEILAPDFWAEFCAITKQVILARPSGQQKLTFRGASSFALWGSITLNVDSHREWWLYIPTLVHEYSHNMLFAMARDEALVLNDPEALYYSPLRQQLRPMDGIFHAAFVSAREAIAAHQAMNSLKSGKLSDQFLAIENYCDDVRKTSSFAFWDCLAVLEEKGELSDLGNRIVRDTKAAMLALG